MEFQNHAHKRIWNKTTKDSDYYNVCGEYCYLLDEIHYERRMIDDRRTMLVKFNYFVWHKNDKNRWKVNEKVSSRFSSCMRFFITYADFYTRVCRVVERESSYVGEEVNVKGIFAMLEEEPYHFGFLLGEELERAKEGFHIKDHFLEISSDNNIFAEEELAYRKFKEKEIVKNQDFVDCPCCSFMKAFAERDVAIREAEWRRKNKSKKQSAIPAMPQMKKGTKKEKELRKEQVRKERIFTTELF